METHAMMGGLAGVSHCTLVKTHLRGMKRAFLRSLGARPLPTTSCAILFGMYLDHREFFGTVGSLV